MFFDPEKHGIKKHQVPAKTAGTETRLLLSE